MSLSHELRNSNKDICYYINFHQITSFLLFELFVYIFMKSSISYCEWINVISLRNMALAMTFIELDLRSTSYVDNLAQLQFIVVETKKQ